MIDGIRRRLSKSVETESWNTDQELEPETEEPTEVPTDTAVILAASQRTPGFSPGNGNLMDYYKSLMKTAIENGGKYGEHEIPIPWLRMILAGLESRYIDPETMWYEVGEGSVSQLPEAPRYEDVFPSDGDFSPR